MLEELLRMLDMYQQCVKQRNAQDPHIRLGSTMGEIDCLIELDLLLFPKPGSDLVSIRRRRLEVVRRLRSISNR